ncbi:MAG: MFS transporter [Pasteurella oralis]|uniref:MFS transporter n=1 Tax=Pasteurella oralis TaxID=1071947 RepID=UPI00270ED995|nr:MFS transporter [Pasteurella oralis]
MKNFLSLGKNFWLYRFSFLLSSLTSIATNISINWWILDTYQKAIYVSYTLIPATIIYISISFLLSPLGDKFSRKKLIQIGILIQISAFIILIIIYNFLLLDIFYLIVFQALFSLGNGIARIGSTSFIVDIVEENRITEANNIIMRLNSAISILSLIFGGAIVAYFDFIIAFSIYLILSICSIFLISLINVYNNVNLNKNIKFFDDLLLGIKYTITSDVIRGLFFYSMIMGIVFGPLQLIIIYIIKEIMKMSSFDYSFAMSGMSIGIILGSYLYEKIKAKFSYMHLFMVFSSCLFILGLVCIYFSYYSNVFIFAMIMIGIARNWINVTVDSHLLKTLDPAIRTKVLLNMSFFGNISVPLSALFTGGLLDTLGIPFILLTNIVLVGIAIGVFLFNQAVIGFLNSPVDRAKQMLHF